MWNCRSASTGDLPAAASRRIRSTVRRSRSSMAAVIRAVASTITLPSIAARACINSDGLSPSAPTGPASSALASLT
jgi:hypothetical protein